MRAIGVQLLENTKNLKFVLNENGILFFPTSQQHRDSKIDGLSYEDDYRGNAVAGLITFQHVEIRFHSAFSDDRIRNLWLRVLGISEVAKAELGPLYYQGREIR